MKTNISLKDKKQKNNKTHSMQFRILSTIIFATVLLLLVVINIRAERNRRKEEALR